MNGGSFSKTLARLEGQVKKLDMALHNTQVLYRSGNWNLIYEVALRVAAAAEQTVLTARALPACTGRPAAAADVQKTMEATIPVEIGFTEQGWFSLRMPMLLPKKESGSADYVRSFLYPAMRKFFDGKPPVRFRDCVLIYRHVYDADRPERQRRDHDNIETNMVSDIVALYVLEDDAPDRCRLYYCSAAAADERTEVYVVPAAEFSAWLALEPAMPEEGVTLHETPRESPEKGV